MSSQTVAVGVLASGRGSNLEAILKKERAGYFARARIACVVSNVPTARALEVARQHNVPEQAIVPKQYADRDSYENAVVTAFERHNVQYVVMAGYMKIVGPVLLSRFSQRIINIHPSLLPAFPGLDGQKQALEYGVKVSGCTVHFADAGVDTGPIILQRAVPVMQDDTEQTLSARILEQEHHIFAEALKLVTETPWEIRGRVVRFL